MNQSTSGMGGSVKGSSEGRGMRERERGKYCIIEVQGGGKVEGQRKAAGRQKGERSNGR